MAEQQFRFVGPKEKLVEFRNELLEARTVENENPEYEVGDLQEARPDPLNPPKQGMEPLTYFVVVFSAHLSAEAVKFGVKRLVEWAGKKGVRGEER